MIKNKKILKELIKKEIYFKYFVRLAEVCKIHLATKRTSLCFILSYFLSTKGERARSSSMVEYQLMMRGLVGSIPHGGPIELFVIPTSAP